MVMLVVANIQLTIRNMSLEQVHLKAICCLIKFGNVRNSPKKDDRKEHSRDNKTDP